MEHLRGTGSRARCWGVAIAVVAAGLPFPQWSGMSPVPPITDAFTRSTADGVFIQLAMTIGNTALTASLLFFDLFDEDGSPDELSTSMGTTNLVAIPAGGIPMCHGCDGVAGKYEFGARTRTRVCYSLQIWLSR